ncbi:MAG: hypothetical protein WCC36_12270 [Gammaproteobacteria bacterium]
MVDRQHVLDLGAPDPELKNSPIMEETDEEFEVLAQEVSEEPVCYFNGMAYENGSFVRSGTELLHCENGAWVREGSADPDNP